FGSEKANPDKLTSGPGKEWDITRYLAIKLLPGAHQFHPVVEAAVNSARQAGVPAEAVTKILVSGPQARIDGSETPRDFVEAIHSLPYFIASAVADRDFSWVHATPEKIHNPAVVRLIKLIEADPSPPAFRYEWNWGGTVTIVTNSGARYTN